MSAPSAARVVRRLTTRPCDFRFEDRLVRERVKSARLLTRTCVLSPFRSNRNVTSAPSAPNWNSEIRHETAPTGPARDPRPGGVAVGCGARDRGRPGRVERSPDAASGVRSQRPAPRNKSTGLVLKSHVTAALRHAQRETATQGSAQTLNTTTSGLMRCDSWRRAVRTSRQACGVPPPSRARGS
jgi:hypothetical protein